jgi:predicted nucleotide-binding protein (sugar kinase/HSP70/actin superfamily)
MSLSRKPTTGPAAEQAPPESFARLGRSARAETFVQQELAEERRRLQRELGLAEEAVHHFRRPEERPFTKDERPHTTVLFGGLTWKHEHLIHGALAGLGYRCEYLPAPDIGAFQLGKEFGNNGQCSPTYFTVGNLIRYLQGLEQQGLSRREIVDRYVFLTVGSCGPCRFGMYEAEYRLALRNAGFDGFRVLLFQQSGGLQQSGLEAGLELNADFFLGILNAVVLADLLNDVAYQLRPFEVHEGETDRVLRQGMELLREALANRRPYRLPGVFGTFLGRFPRALRKIELAGKFLHQLYSADYPDRLRPIAAALNRIEVDRTRAKPVVKITGEFWVQTTEGDGNFSMFHFLEREGAQVLIDPVSTFVTYIIHQYKQKVRDRLGLHDGAGAGSRTCFLGRCLATLKQWRLLHTLTLAEVLFRREWRRLRRGLDAVPHELTDQYVLKRLANPFYNSRAGGGEGYMEVAKNIYYHDQGLCHMVLSLKSFGCLPSTQSDGAQSAVVSQFRSINFLPIETSGEGEINAHSRVQMALGEAKIRCKEEFSRSLAATGLSLAKVRAYADAHPELKKGLYTVPRTEGTVGLAANFVYHVARLQRGAPGR